MPKRMLIDASHPEETRVVVLDGNRVEEFDFEAASKRPLKGNIYLAKVTRVEPSLQAAFVEYGGNRQGFLAFSEIHPDYYQIPVADRMALLAAQTERGDGRRRGRIRLRRRGNRPGTEIDARRRRQRGGRASADDGCDRRCTILRAARRRHRRERRRPTTPSVGEERESRPSRRSRTRPKPGTRGESEADTRRRGPRGRHRNGSRRSRGVDGRPATPSQTRSERPSKTAAPAPIQDPGSDQAPADHAGAGRQGRARQQGRLAHDVPLARGPLLRADAQHAARRRHLAQDHQRHRPQAAESRGPIAGTARGHGPHHPHRRRQSHQARDQARLRISAAAVGHGARADAQVERAGAGLRGRQPDQARDPRSLQQGHVGNPGRRRSGLPRRQRLHAHADAQPCEEREAVQRGAAAVSALPGRGAARRDVQPGGDAEVGRIRRHQPDRGPRLHRRQFRQGHARTFDRGDRATRPISKPRTRSPANCACAISPASS